MSKHRLAHFLLGESAADGACLYRSMIKSLWYRFFSEELEYDHKDYVPVQFSPQERFVNVDQFIETILVRWLKWSIHLFASSELPIENIFSDSIVSHPCLSNYKIINSLQDISQFWHMTRRTAWFTMSTISEPPTPTNYAIPFFVLFFYMRSMQLRYHDALRLSDSEIKRSRMPFNRDHFDSLMFLTNPIYINSSKPPYTRTVTHEKEKIDINALKREAAKTHNMQRPTDDETIMVMDHTYKSLPHVWGGSEEVQLVNMFMHRNTIGFSMLFCEVFVLIVNGKEQVVLNNTQQIDCENTICMFCEGNHYVPVYWVDHYAYEKNKTVISAFPPVFYTK
jgi:hypothetical protein